MSGLLSILSSTVGGLQAATGAAATASNNIQNVDTPGYAREVASSEEASVTTLSPGIQMGGGAILGNVTEVRSSFIESQLPALLGDTASSTAQSNALQAMSAFDDGANGNSLATAIANFFSGLQAMSADPSDTSLRTAVLGDATSMAQAFNAASASVSSAQSGLDQQVSGNIGQINQLATQMASLNQQIQVAQAEGASPNSLIDARTQAEDTLGQLTGATPVTDSSGDVSMMLPSGDALVSGTTASQLSTIPDPTNGGHLAVQITPPGGTATTIADSGLGGTLGGTLAARDGALAQASSGLDNLAYSLGTAINTVQSAGFGTDGSTGNNFFDVGASATGAAAAMVVAPALGGNPAAIAAASTAGSPGDGTNLTAMINVQSQAMAGGTSPADALSSLVSSYGAASQQATAESTNDAALSSSLQAQQQSVSGVSSDEEIVNLTQAQQTYEAVSHVIQTTDDMLESLMSIQTTAAN